MKTATSELVLKNIQQQRKKPRLTTDQPCRMANRSVQHDGLPKRDLTVTEILKYGFDMDSTMARQLSMYGINRDNANDHQNGYGTLISNAYRLKHNKSQPKQLRNVNVYATSEIPWILEDLRLKLRQDGVQQHVDLTE